MSYVATDDPQPALSPAGPAGTSTAGSVARVAAGHGPLTLTYEDVPGLDLPGAAEVVVAAEIDGTSHAQPITLDALAATLAQLPDTARNVVVFRPAPAGRRRDRNIRRRYAAGNYAWMQS